MKRVLTIIGVGLDVLWSSMSTLIMQGQVVRDLARDNYDAGTHSVPYNAGDLPSRIYFGRLAVEQNSIAKKMVLLK